VIKAKPIGRVTFKECHPYSSQMTSGAKLVFEDSDGNLWSFDAVTFNFDLEPHCASQTQKFAEWAQFVRHHSSTKRSFEWLIEQYRNGVTIEKAIE
jgi:hypothetical protein